MRSCHFEAHLTFYIFMRIESKSAFPNVTSSQSGKVPRHNQNEFKCKHMVIPWNTILMDIQSNSKSSFAEKMCCQVVNFFCGCADLRKGALIIGIIKLVNNEHLFFDKNHLSINDTRWQKFREGAKCLRRKVWTYTKIHFFGNKVLFFQIQC